jgi:glycosyltransferase involved in cell wall biosynthesis
MLANVSVPSISVIIPAYNEEATIERVVGQTDRVLQAIARDYEIVVLDDGSTDGTWAAMNRARGVSPRIRLLRNRANMGIGQALMPLVRASRKDLVFMLPGDGQIPPSELQRLLPLAGRFELVNGVRSPRRDPAHRRLLGCVFNLVISALGGVSVRDVDSSTLYRGDLVRALPVMSRGAFVHAELFLRSVRAGARVSEVRIAHRPREAGRPTGAQVRVILGAAKDLLRYVRAERRRGGGSGVRAMGGPYAPGAMEHPTPPSRVREASYFAEAPKDKSSGKVE